MQVIQRSVSVTVKQSSGLVNMHTDEPNLPQQHGGPTSNQLRYIPAPISLIIGMLTKNKTNKKIASKWSSSWGVSHRTFFFSFFLDIITDQVNRVHKNREL